MLAGEALECGDPCLIDPDRIRGLSAIIATARFVLLDPDPDRVTGNVVPLC